MQGAELTDRQREVLQAIREHIERDGVPPSRAQLAKSLRLPFASGVKSHLKALERKGWIQINPKMDRGIQLLREGRPVFDFGMLASVPAGTPALADDSPAAFRVSAELARRIHPQADFYVVVHGDSMDKVGYRSGDIVAVKRNPDPREGEVVLARIGQDVTLKCFHRTDDGRIELQPRSSNPEHQIIVIGPHTEDWQVVGVVVGAMIAGPPKPVC